MRNAIGGILIGAGLVLGANEGELIIYNLIGFGLMAIGAFVFIKSGN